VTILQAELRDQLRAARKAPAREPWREPTYADFAYYERALALDATLTHTGWIDLEATPAGILVYDKGIINIATDQRGYMETWEKALLLTIELEPVLHWARLYGTHVVVEAPLSRNVNRFESTLIAGLLVYLDRRRHHQKCHMISATHASAVLLGDAKTRSAERKPKIREAVTRLIPEAGMPGWNEHIRDAAAVGLTHLFDEKRRRMAQRGNPDE
jgi:Holliday junction resolvasome RuvABC endonuclease subunit